MKAPLSRLSVGTLGDHTYRALKAAILSLDLLPGTSLDEGHIASVLGVSKTPVREALARLSGEGFVVPDAGRRSRVAGLSLETIRDVYEFRILLESSSIQQVTEDLPDTVLGDLERTIDRAGRALAREDLLEYVTANDEFHRTLIHCNRNLPLRKVVDDLLDQVCRVRAAVYRSEQGLAHHLMSERGIENHRRILHALSARDAERAARMMGDDIRLFLDVVMTPTMQAAFHHLQEGADTGQVRFDGRKATSVPDGEWLGPHELAAQAPAVGAVDQGLD